MTPVRIAVTGPSGDVGHGIVCALRECMLPLWTLGLDRTQTYPAVFHLDLSVPMPPVAASNYIDTLIEVLSSHSVDYLFCGIDSEVPLLAEHQDRIRSESGCRVIVASHELVANCADKLQTATWLRSLDLKMPATWSVEQLQTLVADGHTPDLPLITKPRRGHNSIGVRLISNDHELEQELRQADSDACFQEYLAGEEFTCGLLFDKSGRLCDWIVTQRTLSGGRTIFAKTREVPAIEQLISDFGSKVDALGALNLQLRLDSQGQPAVFEINPRVSGSTLLRLDAGHNDPARILENLVLDSPIERTPKPLVQIHREWTTVVRSTASKPIIPQGSDRQTIVLDCGGTLLQVHPTPTAVCHRVLQAMGFQIPFRKLEEAFRMVDFSMKRRSSAETSDSDREQFYQQFNSRIADAVGIGSHSSEFHERFYVACSNALNWMPLPFVNQSLERLSQRFRLLVLANWDSGLPTLLQQHGLHDHIDGIYDSESLGCEKPSPDVFARFAEQAEMNPAHSIYIGNEYEADIAASRRAGFAPVLLDTTSRYSPSVDCPYFTNWNELTDALLAVPSDPA